MQSDSIYPIKGLTRSQRVRKLHDQVTKVKAIRDQLIEDRAGREREIETLSSRQEVLSKVSELYRVLMDRMVMGQLQVIERVVTEGLKTIFFDQDLSFKAELSSKYNRVSADLFICQGDPEKGGIKGSPLDSFGGGPSSITSLILRVLTILRLKRRKLLLLDETLAAVSDDYIETTGQFLRKLSEAVDIPILIVTHKPAFLDHSATAYQGESKLSPTGKSQFMVKSRTKT
jgi:hypothetical protein